MMRFWNAKRFGDERGFTLIELMIVIAIIGILAAIAIPLYSNMQARARVAKAQADLRGLYSALAAFNAHCGDAPNAGLGPVTSPATITFAAGATVTCAVAIAGDPTFLGDIVTDASGVPAGPFYTGQVSPPGAGATAWSYQYTYIGPGRFVLSGCNVADLPGCAAVTKLPAAAGNTAIHFP